MSFRRAPILLVVWIHAYDIADLFLATLTSPKAAGKRLLGVSGRMSWAQVRDIVKTDRNYPPTKADAPTMNFPGADVIEFATASRGSC